MNKQTLKTNNKSNIITENTQLKTNLTESDKFFTGATKVDTKYALTGSTIEFLITDTSTKIIKGVLYHCDNKKDVFKVYIPEENIRVILNSEDITNIDGGSSLRRSTHEYCTYCGHCREHYRTKKCTYCGSTKETKMGLSLDTPLTIKTPGSDGISEMSIEEYNEQYNEQ